MDGIQCVYHSKDGGIDRCAIKNYCDYSRCTIMVDKAFEGNTGAGLHKPTVDELMAFWVSEHTKASVGLKNLSKKDIVTALNVCIQVLNNEVAK